MGGVAFVSNSSIEMSNSFMDYNNASKSDETLYLYNNTYAKVDHLSFQNNKAEQYGGGIYGNTQSSTCTIQME